MKYHLTIIKKKIGVPLSHIVSDWFNKSVTIGKLPSCLKEARIVLVFKGGDNTVVKKLLTNLYSKFPNQSFRKADAKKVKLFFTH